MKKLHSKEVKISKIDEQVNIVTANPNDLSSVPRIHIVRGEKQLLQADLCPIYAYCHDSLSLFLSHKNILKTEKRND